MGNRIPSYVSAFRDGRLAKAAETARNILRSCDLCPQKCRVDRMNGELGVCRTGQSAMVSSCSPHFGEEAPLVGRNGSGTIFFTHCNLLCVFCQNFDISHGGIGVPASSHELADMMLALQNNGCHNLNFVTPSHVVPQILDALVIAASRGLHIPLVYNSSGYDRVETLTLLDGVVDIYMPDFKFWRSETAHRFCNAPEYPAVARAAVREMHRQVGDLAVGGDGVAMRGLLIRHLVLPGDLADTREIMRFIARDISADSYVNIMPQYRPCGHANRFPPIDQQLASNDYEKAMEVARSEGLKRLDPPVRKFVVW